MSVGDRTEVPYKNIKRKRNKWPNGLLPTNKYICGDDATREMDNGMKRDEAEAGLGVAAPFHAARSVKRRRHCACFHLDVRPLPTAADVKATRRLLMLALPAVPDACWAEFWGCRRRLVGFHSLSDRFHAFLRLKRNPVEQSVSMCTPQMTLCFGQ